MPNHLKRERQVQIVQMTVEGNSIRSIERMTGWPDNGRNRTLPPARSRLAELANGRHTGYMNCGWAA